MHLAQGDCWLASVMRGTISTPSGLGGSGNGGFVDHLFEGSVGPPSILRVVRHPWALDLQQGGHRQ